MKKYKTRVIPQQQCSCSICNGKFDNLSSLSHHVSRTHKLSSNEYYDTFLKKKDEGTCECGNDTQYKSIVDGYRKYCSRACGDSSQSRAKRILQTKKEKYGEGMDAIYTKAKLTVSEWDEETKNKYRQNLSAGVKRAIADDPTITTRRLNTLMSDPVKFQSFKTSISEGHSKRSPDEIAKSTEQRKATNLDKYGTEAVYAHLNEFTLEQRQTNAAKAVQTKIKNGTILPPNHPQRNQKQDYKNNVRKISEIWAVQLFSKDELDNRGLLGVDGAVQLDHIVSLEDCFTNNVPEEIAGHAVNLQIVSWEHNIKKSAKSGMLVEELVTLYEEWENSDETN